MAGVPLKRILNAVVSFTFSVASRSAIIPFLKGDGGSILNLLPVPRTQSIASEAVSSLTNGPFEMSN